MTGRRNAAPEQQQPRLSRAQVKSIWVPCNRTLSQSLPQAYLPGEYQIGEV
jgi:hypothetical protein